MLKTLRITSLAALILAVCGVFLIVFLGLRENPEIIAYLNSPGVVGKFENQVTDGEKKELESPLVAQAHAFALRINPPPPKPVVKAPEPIVKPPVREKPVAVKPPPPPPVPPTAKFTLLATVLCEENPSRSMVLLRQAGNKDEWFWQGERVGNLDVTEVRNGSAVFTQSGRNPQELYVPEKPKTKSLLKAEATAPSRPAGAGTGSISILVDPETGEPITQEQAAAAGIEPAAAQPTVVPASSRSVSTDRNRDTLVTRQEVSDRIRRIRTVPKQPEPADQATEIEQNIQILRNAMNQELSTVDEAQRQEESEVWMKLIEVLQSEKEQLETNKDAPQEGEETPEATKEGESVTDTPTENPNEE